MRSVQPGGIILLHEGRRDRDGRAVNLIAIERLLRRLTSEGLGTTLPRPEELA
jgi:hypothetical protein